MSSRAYNRDDCISTWLLRDWLEDRRREAIARGWAMPRPVVTPEDAAAVEARLAETRRREDALRRDLDEGSVEREPADEGRWLLSWLVDWHRREDKPGYWRYKLLQGLSTEQLLAENDALAGLTPVGRVEDLGRGTGVFRYAFPRQDHKLRDGKDVLDPRIGDWGADAGHVVRIDDVALTLDLRRTKSMQERGDPISLLWDKPIQNTSLREGIGRLADWVIDHGIDADGPHRAARDLLLRRPPRLVTGLSQGDLRGPGETGLDAAIRLATTLDSGVLGIQGPPGTGKTWTGARMALELLRQGKRVGVTAQSHKAISNFLRALDQAVADGDARPTIAQACDNGDDATDLGDHVWLEDDPLRQRRKVHELLADGATVAAGTAWLFARPAMAGAVDALFVDEAGQMSLANVMAMSSATTSIVLLGDPNQLPQVTQGVHPYGADASALGHLIGEDVTISPQLGLLLDTTYRMHPAVNRYISSTFYDGRIATAPSTLGQAVAAGEPGGVGIRWHPVEHAGNDSSSVQEAEAVVEAMAALVGRDVDRSDRPRTDDHRRRHRHRRPLQPPGRRHRGRSQGARHRTLGRHRRQVPGSGGCRRHLLHDQLVGRGRAARHGLPLRAQPAQRGHLARAGAGHPRREPGAAPRPLPDARPDEEGERAVRLPGDGRRRRLSRWHTLESLSSEVAVEREGRVDPMRSHDLEARPIHQRDLAPLGGQKGRHGRAMELLVDPYDVDEWEQAIEQITHSGRAEAVLDDSGGLDDHVTVREERFALEEEAKGLIRRCMVDVVVVEQCVHRRGVDEGRHSRYASTT